MSQQEHKEGPGTTTPLLEVLRLLEGQDVNQVPVVADDRLVGMITRDHLLRVLAAKMELGLPGKEAVGVDNGV